MTRGAAGCPLATAVMMEIALAAAVPGAWVGASWSRCLLLLVLVLASVRVPLAGALADLVSGAAAATIYALGCGGTSPTSAFIWYMLAMALPAMLGMLVALAVLRW